MSDERLRPRRLDSSLHVSAEVTHNPEGPFFWVMWCTTHNYPTSQDSYVFVEDDDTELESPEFSCHVWEPQHPCQLAQRLVSYHIFGQEDNE